jgi:hypothetical protein
MSSSNAAPRRGGHQTLRRLILTTLLLTGIAVSASARAGAPARYDVSYYSDADLAKVVARRKAVASALGPRVSHRLRIVLSAPNYFLIYLRHGDEQGAQAAAAAHSRILRRRGLGEASCIASRPWAVVPDTGARHAPKPEPPEAAEATEKSERQGLETLVADHVAQLRREGRLAADERTA